MARSTQLTQEAIQIANGFQRRELDLKKKQLEVELQLQQVKAHREASRLAAQRGFNYQPSLGLIWRAPNAGSHAGSTLS